jgi:DNA-binding MurR/RpiR family transcriptional regulator
MADIVILNPRFDTSFWGMEHCIGVLGKRANLPVASLALLAALVADRHAVTLVDENVEDIDFERLGRADLVCLTGMSIQARRMAEILTEVRSRGVMTVVGGPLATVEEETLRGLADVVFVGEADARPQGVRRRAQTLPQGVRPVRSSPYRCVAARHDA